MLRRPAGARCALESCVGMCAVGLWGMCRHMAPVPGIPNSIWSQVLLPCYTMSLLGCAALSRAYWIDTITHLAPEKTHRSHMRAHALRWSVGGMKDIADRAGGRLLCLLCLRQTFR